mgnify:CR=1 FL=1
MQCFRVIKTREAFFMTKFITAIVKKVGALQREQFSKSIRQIKKGDWGDFLTATDLASEKILINAIKKRYPTHTIIAEEGGMMMKDKDNVWYIDPLDGTNNFSNRIPFFCISVAFQHKGRAHTSVIYDPIHDECFTANDRGFFINGRKTTIKNTRLNETMLAIEIPPNTQKRGAAEHTLRALPKIFWKTRMIKSLGSTALELAYVAAGRLGAFALAGLFYPWDIAAGAHCITAAGGIVTDWRGKPWSPTMGSIIAATPASHKELLTILKKQ